MVPTSEHPQTSYDKLLEKISALKSLPKKTYDLDIVDDHKTIVQIDTQSAMVTICYIVVKPCKCCFEHETIEESFEDLDYDIQFNILGVLFKKYCQNSCFPK